MSGEDVGLVALAIIITLGGFVGCLYSGFTIRESRIDLAVAERMDAPESIRIIGRGHIRSERYRFCTQALFTVIGAISIVTTFIDDAPAWVRAVTRIGLVIAISLVYLNSALNSRTRKAALEALVEEAGT